MSVATDLRPRRTAQLPTRRSETLRGRRADPHFFTYTVGNALAWILWAAFSVSADHWYWWAVVPLLGWTVVLGIHAALMRRRQENPRPTA